MLRILWLSLLVLAPCAYAGVNEDLVAFALSCAKAQPTSGIAAGHQLRLVAFAKLFDAAGKEKYTLMETAYISGVGHLGMNDFLENNRTKEKYLYLGEAEFDAQNRLVRIIDTSGFAMSQKVTSNGKEFVRLLKEMAPERVSPQGVEILEYSRERQHLDRRLVSDKTDNVRHDFIDQQVTAFIMEADGYASGDQVPGPAETKLLERNLSILKLYAKMLREEGRPLAVFERLIDELEAKKIPSRDLVRSAVDPLRKTRPGFRTEEENEALVTETIWTRP